MSPLTRDDPAYWTTMPADHTPAGFFVHGPQEERPSWPHKVKTGNANRAPATESRGAALQRMDTERRRRLYRMALAVAGLPIGRNRKSRAA